MYALDAMLSAAAERRRRVAAAREDGKKSGPNINKNYAALPKYNISYPNNDIRLRHIAPYDVELQTLIHKYFPTNHLKPTAAKANCKAKDGLYAPPRPRSLSLQPNLGDLQWNKCESDVAYAMSITLYEEEPTATGACQNAGDPIADCCAVITTQNMVIMVCADGCGWGDRARTAARTAVLIMLKSLTDNVFSNVYTSEDIFKYLNSGLNAVQQGLITGGGTGLTTLCATVVAPLKDNYETKLGKEHEWVICNVRVGDTSTYLYNFLSEELSLISHRFEKNTRDMKDCGGCLGPVIGSNPDLDNLTFSVTLAQSSSTVFLATDGVGDNFNPFVTNQLSRKLKQGGCPSNLLIHKVYCSCSCNEDSLGSSASCDMNDYFRHEKLEVSKADIEVHNEFCDCENTSPMLGEHEICATLVDILSVKYLQQTISTHFIDGSVQNFVSTICRMLVNATDAKRKAMSRYKTRIRTLSQSEVNEVSRIHRNYVKTLPGKLDHASLVAANLQKLKSLDITSACSTEGFTRTIYFERPSPSTSRSRSSTPSSDRPRSPMIRFSSSIDSSTEVL